MSRNNFRINNGEICNRLKRIDQIEKQGEYKHYKTHYGEIFFYGCSEKHQAADHKKDCELDGLAPIMIPKINTAKRSAMMPNIFVSVIIYLFI